MRGVKTRVEASPLAAFLPATGETARNRKIQLALSIKSVLSIDRDVVDFGSL
jgi:hypothetical protein